MLLPDQDLSSCAGYATIGSPSHKEPLITGQTETATVVNQRKGSDNMIVSVLTVTEDPGRSERIINTEQNDNINFNLQKFCTLLKEEFKRIFEEKYITTQHETSDSIAIANMLIQCFREASKGAEEDKKSSTIRFDVIAHSSQDADDESKLNNIKPIIKDDVSPADEDEKQLDKTVEQFVKDTYQLAVSALEKQKRHAHSI
ncbi:uncharacterized protein LOC129961995 [Argiope bruennichi]|uniref:uncharacterized protein LOC129961995 n=1 Tax=Argiope bruennichi TaxID=94029 RepID=UPI002493F6E4|nr:uncharacterized protein LOC129961995 [Argiope bruennichi]